MHRGVHLVVAENISDSTVSLPFLTWIPNCARLPALETNDVTPGLADSPPKRLECVAFHRGRIEGRSGRSLRTPRTTHAMAQKRAREHNTRCKVHTSVDFESLFVRNTIEPGRGWLHRDPIASSDSNLLRFLIANHSTRNRSFRLRS